MTEEAEDELYDKLVEERKILKQRLKEVDNKLLGLVFADMLRD